jgi:Coenzyme PQQ synthesis protein D (PqqD)
VLLVSHTIRRIQTPDGAVLLNVERGQMFSLNPVGSKILELLDAGVAQAQIAEQVSAAWSADLEMVERDVRDFIEALRRHEILQCRLPGTTPNGGKP